MSSDVLSGIDGALSSGAGAVAEGAEVLSGAVAEGAEVVAGAAAAVGAGEVLLVVGGVVVVVAASAILYDAATGTATFDPSAIRTPAVPPPPTTTVPPQPSHPTKPVVTGTKQQTHTTSWQTTTKWYDDTYLYTRTDYYSYTTTQQWTYYDNGTHAYRWWRRPTRHRWVTERQPLFDVDNPIVVPTTAPAKPTAPTITAVADDKATCGTRGASGNSCAAGSRNTGLPPGVTPDTATGNNGGGIPPGSSASQCMPDPANGSEDGDEREARGVRQGDVERTLENSLDKTTYLYDAAAKYGINLRGSGQDIGIIFDPDLNIGIIFDPDLNIGTNGVTRAADGGNLIRVGPDGVFDDATAANTIAHELRHARYFLKHGTFEGEEHGDGDSLDDCTPYGSGNALEDWIKGNR
ncbi:MAG: hypothetical protein JF597_32305 [Streptomyces sp.]|uniref:hypothetical protein n=1 Tax=Streptomyces sp. TaxID=1931 RepID=UPI0025CE2DD5|nr:hypothetical protein [Streptomyces sp.]MBW8798103.1 hypothetical protein [Streptomyces sp.]